MRRPSAGEASARPPGGHTPPVARDRAAPEDPSAKTSLARNGRRLWFPYTRNVGVASLPEIGSIIHGFRGTSCPNDAGIYDYVIVDGCHGTVETSR